MQQVEQKQPAQKTHDERVAELLAAMSNRAEAAGLKSFDEFSYSSQLAPR